MWGNQPKARMAKGTILTSCFKTLDLVPIEALATKAPNTPAAVEPNTPAAVENSTVVTGVLFRRD